MHLINPVTTRSRSSAYNPPSLLGMEDQGKLMRRQGDQRHDYC